MEWLDGKISKLEEKVMEFKRKYGPEFFEFDERIKREGVSFEEEDDWIDRGTIGEKRKVGLMREFRSEGKFYKRQEKETYGQSEEMMAS